MMTVDDEHVRVYTLCVCACKVSVVSSLDSSRPSGDIDAPAG